MAIIVSEERGEISVSSNGTLQKVKTPEELADIIAKFTGNDSKGTHIKHEVIKNLFLKNPILKTAALSIGIIFWFFSVHKAGIVKINYSIPIEYRYVSSDIVIASSLPDSINITVTGSNRDVSNLGKDDIKVIVDADKFMLGNNEFSVDQKNIE